MIKKLLFIVNDPDFFLSHRLPIAQGATKIGYEVHVATKAGAGTEHILALGLKHHRISLSRSGKNPFAELRTVWAIFKLLRNIKPDVVHLVTIKPVLYGGIAARLLNVPSVVAAFPGLGFIFTTAWLKAQPMRSVVGVLYRLALGKRNLIALFQNSDDRSVLLQLGAVSPDKTILIPGSGVNLLEYSAVPESEGIPVVTMAARLLWDKGVGEFVEAARLLNEKGVSARFVLAGDTDPENPASITKAELDAWRGKGHVEVLGFCRNIPEIFSTSNIVVLPSYYGEGLPKVLVEAAACGRAVITTDMPGCRDAIEPDVTGLLVPARDAVALANAIQRLVEDKPLRHRMGKAGRELAERKFAIEKIVDAHLEIYRSLEQRV